MSNRMQSNTSSKSTTAAVLMALGGILGIIPYLFGATGLAEEGTAMMNKAADDHFIHHFESTISIFGGICIALAMVFAIQLFAGRGSRVGIIGVVLTTIGNLASLWTPFLLSISIPLSESSSGVGIWDSIQDSGFMMAMTLGIIVLTVGMFFLLPISLFMSGRLPLWAMIACFVLGLIWLVPLPDIIVVILYMVPLFLIGWGFSQGTKQIAAPGSIQSSVN